MSLPAASLPKTFLGHLLVATDGRISGGRAVTFAIALARRHDSDIKLCYAVDRISALGESYGGYGGDGDTILPMLEALDDAAMAILRKARDRVQSAGIAATLNLLDGGPASAIVACETTGSFDAVVMGTQSRQGLQRFLTGCVAASVLRGSSIPVFVVPPTVDVDHIAFDRVLLAVDSFGVGDAGLKFALAFCTANNAHLTVCNVASTSDGNDVSAQVRVAIAARQAESAGVPCDTCVMHGDPAHGVLVAAIPHKADLIVVETQAGHRLHQWIYGSVSDTVAEGSHVPVVVVPGDGRLRP